MRAGTRAAVYAQRAAERLAAVGEPAQPRAARRVGAPRAVVGHVYHKPERGRSHRDVRARVARVLGDVREALGAEEERGRLLRGRKAAGGHLEPDCNGGLRDQLVEGLAEASFGERARVNAARESEQLSSGGVEIARKLAQRLTDLPLTLPGEPRDAVA